jgi:DNA-binding response OmpR family regulator
MRILIVDDDTSTAAAIKVALTQQNYVVDVATDGEIGWQMTEAFSYDLLLLDVMLPKLDGVSFCRRLREQKKTVPVMLLTARDTTSDKLSGLDSGADDYVVKPFDVLELTARIRALLRRGSNITSPVLECGKLRLNPSTREVTYDSLSLHFTRREYLLVELFLRHPGRVFSRSEIVDHFWDSNKEPPSEDTVKSYIKSIRRKLDAVGAIDWIETLYGQGYRINQSYFTSHEAAITTNRIPKQRLNLALEELWQKTKVESFQRVALLEEAIATLQQDAVNPTCLQTAIHQAHTLAGCLGTYGFAEASQIAERIEVLLEGKLSIPRSTHQAEQLLAHLKQEIDFQLPLIQPDLIPGKNTSSPPVMQARARILLVDDDVQILAASKTLLEPLGLQVACLNQPEQFWETLEAVQPDLLILDLNMPNVSGLELCQSIRSHAQWSWLPILFLTVQTDFTVIQKAYSLGADDYISKPIISEELLIRVLNRLRRCHTMLKSQPNF